MFSRPSRRTGTTRAVPNPLPVTRKILSKLIVLVHWRAGKARMIPTTNLVIISGPGDVFKITLQRLTRRTRRREV
jgi:hypothetical protein